MSVLHYGVTRSITRVDPLSIRQSACRDGSRVALRSTFPCLHSAPVAAAPLETHLRGPCSHCRVTVDESKYTSTRISAWTQVDVRSRVRVLYGGDDYRLELHAKPLCGHLHGVSRIYL